MNTFKISLSVVLCTILVSLPTYASAYFTTEQKTYQLDEETLLFKITYQFGMKKDALRMPIGAVRDMSTTSPYLGFSFVTEDNTVFDLGSSSAIVISEGTEVVDSEYYVPAGKAASFTLVALLKVPSSTLVSLSENDIDVSLQVTSLPFSMDRDGKEQAGKLNPSELQYYVTPSVDIK